MKTVIFANTDVYKPLWCNILEKSDSFPLSRNDLIAFKSMFPISKIEQSMSNFIKFEQMKNNYHIEFCTEFVWKYNVEWSHNDDFFA